MIRLVRELMAREEVGGSLRNQRFPILVVEGFRGAGKTALLSTLDELLDQRVPYARLDFEANRHASIPEALSALAFGLGRKCPRYGVLQFPRFIIGQLVMELELDLTDHELQYRLPDLTEDEVGSAVAALALDRGNNRRLTRVIFQLTRGHPASTRLVVDAIAKNPPENLIKPEVTLSQAPSDEGPHRSQTVEDQILGRLLAGIPDAALRDLVTCAVARERRHALALAVQDDLLVGGQANYVEVLDPILWPSDDTAGNGAAGPTCYAGCCAAASPCAIVRSRRAGRAPILGSAISAAPRATRLASCITPSLAGNWGS